MREKALPPPCRARAVALVPLLFQQRWRPAVLAGTKTTTVRSKRHGAVGDEFEVEGVRFRLVEVRATTLGDARESWRDEGMTSPDEFEAVWAANHPTRGFRPSDSVWLHRFERVA